MTERTSSATPQRLYDRLGAMIDQLGYPDYPISELIEGLRGVRDDLLALSATAGRDEIIEELRAAIMRFVDSPDERPGDHPAWLEQARRALKNAAPQAQAESRAIQTQGDKPDTIAESPAVAAPTDKAHGETPRSFHVCTDHKNAEWNQPQIEGDDCVLCRLFYLEAQESLLEEWQQRAQRAEDAIKEIERPLDAQMARLNETIVRLNAEIEQLRSARPEAQGSKWVPCSERLPDDGQECLIYEEGHGCTGPIRWDATNKHWLDLFATYEAGMVYEPKTATGGQVTHWSAPPQTPPQD